MRPLFAFLLRLLFVTGITSLIQPAFKTTSVPSHNEVGHGRKIIYYSPKMETVDSLPVMSGDSDQEFSLNTRRDFRPLLHVLLQQWGKANRFIPGGFDTDSANGIGEYIWNKAQLEQQAAELHFDIAKYSDTYSLSFDVYQYTTGLRMTGSPKIWNYLTQLIQKDLLNQHEVLQPDTVGRVDLSYNLEELFPLKPDSVFNCFRRYILNGDNAISLEYGISKEGKPEYIRFNEKFQEEGDTLPPVVDSFIHNFTYPLLLNKKNGDTLTYSIKYNVEAPVSVLKNISLDMVKHWKAEGGTTTLALDTQIANNYVTIRAGNVLESNKIHAFIRIEDDSLLYMYTYADGNWKEETPYETDPGYFLIGFEDLNGDGRPEVKCYSFHNSNGNSWMDIFIYKPAENRLVYAGPLYTNYEVKPRHKEIWITYSGSLYMPEEQTLLRWNGDNLLTVKHAELALRKADMKSTEQILSYYENPGWQQGKDTLVLKYKRLYNEKDKSQNAMWSGFFPDK